MESRNALVDRREKALLADFVRQPGAIEKPAKRAVGMRDFQLNLLPGQFPMQVAQGFKGGYVDIRDRLSIEQEPSQRVWIGLDQVAHAFNEVPGVRE